MGARVESRGTILVASASRLFADIVGEMVADSGFTVACPAASEPAWLAVTRTQPCVVICDCDAPVEHIQRLLVEVSAHRIALLLSAPPAEHNSERALTPAQPVVWLTFPISQDAFCSVLDALLPPVTGAAHRMTASAAGMRIDAGISVRTLTPVVTRGAFAQDDRPVASIPTSDALDNALDKARADDDGMTLPAFAPPKAPSIG